MTKSNSYLAKDLETISVLTLAIIVLGLLFKLQFLFVLAGTLLFTGLFVKRVSAVIAHAWLGLAHLLGVLNTKILLTIIYYLMLAPLAILYRLNSVNFMSNSSDKTEPTLWCVREHEYVASDLDKMW